MESNTAADTTNLTDLGASAPPSNVPVQQPTEPVTSYKPIEGTGAEQPPQMTLDQSSINQIINGLQEAHISGATALPSRDIPMDPTPPDPTAQPNYVPPPPPTHVDYIGESGPPMPLPPVEKESALEQLYTEIQYPLLLALLYFIFQMPAFKRALMHNIPILCNVDGNYNSKGLIFTCVIFGGIYYAITKFIAYFI
jgi:hypothetical protein